MIQMPRTVARLLSCDLHRNSQPYPSLYKTRPLKHRYLLALASALLWWCLLITSTPVSASQALSFRVPEMRLQAYVLPDASARFVYDITFANSPTGDAIDIVDIGMPTRDYDLGNMRAWLNETELTDIRDSEFVDPGVEIHLQQEAIPAGGSGTLHFEFTVPEMVYQDTTRDDYASFQLGTTWFDPQFVVGSSDIWILVHMLPEVQPEELLYQDVPFTDEVIFDEHPVAVWHWPDGSAVAPNEVGVSFPRRGMSTVVKQNLIDLTVKWLEDNRQARLILGALTIGLLAVAFFRFSGGTGLTVFVLLAGGVIWLLASNAALQLVALPAAIVVVGLNELQLTRRKQRYLPAIVQVEGGGIKRGLTAPEAAIILELPLNRVLTLILFGLLEKGVVLLESDSPLEVRVAQEFRVLDMKPGKRRNRRLAVAQKLGIVLRSYEHHFLDLLEENQGRPVHEIDFSQPMTKLILHTAERVKGFDLSDTQDYYRRIIQRALQEAKRIGDIPERERYIDKHLQWLLLDKDYPTVFTSWGYPYRPVWIRPFASSDRLGVPTTAPISTKSTPSVTGRTSFGDVAASFAGWTENTMGKMATAISPGALNVEGPRGVVNLSGVDRVTGDIFEALAKSSGGSGGSSGGSCACACAGCACACACAGGGR